MSEVAQKLEQFIARYGQEKLDQMLAQFEAGYSPAWVHSELKLPLREVVLCRHLFVEEVRVTIRRPELKAALLERATSGAAPASCS